MTREATTMRSQGTAAKSGPGSPHLEKVIADVEQSGNTCIVLVAYKGRNKELKELGMLDGYVRLKDDLMCHGKA